MKRPHGLRVRRYAACMIDINNYLAVFPGAKASNKICETVFNGIILNSRPNRWIRQEYVQGFYFESINLKICKHV